MAPVGQRRFRFGVRHTGSTLEEGQRVARKPKILGAYSLQRAFEKTTSCLDSVCVPLASGSPSQEEDPNAFRRAAEPSVYQSRYGYVGGSKCTTP
jgi:CO dehydrogenase/acetyl-CoA synthase delta subunit